MPNMWGRPGLRGTQCHDECVSGGDPEVGYITSQGVPPEDPDALAYIEDRIKRALLVRSESLLPDNRRLPSLPLIPSLPLDANLTGFVVSIPRSPQAGRYVGWGTVKSFNRKNGNHFLKGVVVRNDLGRSLHGAVDLAAFADSEDFGIFRPDNLHDNLWESIQIAQDAR